MSRRIKVNYGYTKNIGNFESERLDASMECDVSDSEDVNIVIQDEYERVRKFVRDTLELDPVYQDYSDPANVPVRRGNH